MSRGDAARAGARRPRPSHAACRRRARRRSAAACVERTSAAGCRRRAASAVRSRDHGRAAGTTSASAYARISGVVGSLRQRRTRRGATASDQAALDAARREAYAGRPRGRRACAAVKRRVERQRAAVAPRRAPRVVEPDRDPWPEKDGRSSRPIALSSSTGSVGAARRRARSASHGAWHGSARSACWTRDTKCPVGGRQKMTSPLLRRARRVAMASLRMSLASASERRSFT